MQIILYPAPLTGRFPLLNKLILETYVRPLLAQEESALT